MSVAMRKIYAIFTIGYLCPIIVALNYSIVCLRGPTCFCNLRAGYEIVFCSKVVVFQPIYKFLHTRSSRLKVILNHCSLSTLPSRVFGNASVFEFISYCPFSEISDDAFDGAEELGDISLVYTTFTSVPYGLQNVRDLRSLVIRNHKLRSLNHELWKLQLLNVVNFKSGTLEELAEDVFARTPYIENLNLSDNRLKFLHQNTLKPLTLLRIINLNRNQILTVDGLLDNIRLEEIDVSYNNLTTVDYVFNTQMQRLKILVISRNPINSFAFLSRDKITHPNLQMIEMEAINCSEIDDVFFVILPFLRVVNLSFNELQHIPKTLFSTHLRYAELCYNSITSIKGLFENSTQLMKLHLANNGILDISHSFQNLMHLEYIGLEENGIERVSNGDFEGLEQMKWLNLSFNKIETIESKCFSGLKSLKYLYLSGNCFKHLNRSLRSLPLTELFADSVCLESIDREEFWGLTKLTNLSLSNNNIASVDGLFRDLESLTLLNVAGNKLMTLSRDTFPENLRLKMLWLASGNQLHCDCRLTWLLEYQAHMYDSVLQDNPLCHFPPRLRGKPIRELTIKEVTDWPENCPVFCRCECVTQGRTFYVRADCSYRNLIRIPDNFPKQLRDLDLSGNELDSLSSLRQDIENDVIALNLGNNKITTLANIPPNLESLRVSGNLLKRLPSSLLSTESLEILTLANNPWICDCETIDFRKWLLSMGDIVKDVNDTKCGPGGLPNLDGKVIIDLTDTDLCPSGIVLYVSLALGLLGTLLLASSLVLMFSRYHLYIKAWLYAHGQTWVKENDTEEEEKRFDAFLSYHLNDEDFVITGIVPILEEVEPKFTLCIPNRDIVCGLFSNVAQLKAMRDCKRIIVVLTQDYINDASCMSVFQQAYQQSLEDKVHRVILIKVGDIDKSEDLNPEVATVVESNRCIPWQGTMFLKRLYYVMPKKISRSVVHDDVDVVELT